MNKKKKIILIFVGCFLFVFTTIIYNPFKIFKLELFFNNVEKVEIYSYQERNLWIETSSQSDLKKLNYIINGEIYIDKKYLRNKITLNDNQISELKSRLRKTFNLDLTYKCYIPRHSLIFYNNENEIFGYIEICFDCNRVISSENLDFISSNSLNLESTLEKFGISYFGKDEQ